MHFRRRIGGKLRFENKAAVRRGKRLKTQDECNARGQQKTGEKAEDGSLHGQSPSLTA